MQSKAQKEILSRKHEMFTPGTVLAILHLGQLFDIRPLQIKSLFLIPPEQKNWCGRAAGNGRLFTSLMKNGRQNHKFSSPKIEAVYFCIVLVLMEIHAGGNQGGDEKQLIDLEWPNISIRLSTVTDTLTLHRYVDFYSYRGQVYDSRQKVGYKVCSRMATLNHMSRASWHFFVPHRRDRTSERNKNYEACAYLHAVCRGVSSK